MMTPSTESPRNSSRSLVGRPPFSYAYERCVRARSSTAGSIVTPMTRSRCSSESCSSVIDTPVSSGRFSWKRPCAGCTCHSSGRRRAATSARGTPGCCNAPTWGRRSSIGRGGCACCCATFSASEPARLTLLLVDDLVQAGPSRVDRLVSMVTADVLEPSPAIGTQTEAVVLAHRRERQCEHHRVTQYRLEIDVIVGKKPDVVVLVVRVYLVAGVDVQLLNLDLEF